MREDDLEGEAEAGGGAEGSFEGIVRGERVKQSDSKSSSVEVAAKKENGGSGESGVILEQSPQTFLLR